MFIVSVGSIGRTWGGVDGVCGGGMVRVPATPDIRNSGGELMYVIHSSARPALCTSVGTWLSVGERPVRTCALPASANVPMKVTCTLGLRILSLYV